VSEKEEQGCEDGDGEGVDRPVTDGEGKGGVQRKSNVVVRARKRKTLCRS